MELALSIYEFSPSLFFCILCCLVIGIIVLFILFTRKNKELANLNIKTGIVFGLICVAYFVFVFYLTKLTFVGTAHFTINNFLNLVFSFFIGFSVGLGITGIFSIISIIFEKYKTTTEN